MNIEADAVPLAERRFFLADDPKPVLVFRVWKPRSVERDYPTCRFELSNDTGVVHSGDVSGVDSLDSLVICLAQAGTEIAGINESMFDGQLRWEASPEGGRSLGLPTLETLVGSGGER